MAIQIFKAPQADPLAKLANAVDVAKNIYGIYTNSQTLDMARQKAEEEKNSPVKKYQEQVATRGMANDTAANDPNSPETKAARDVGRATILAWEKTGPFKPDASGNGPLSNFKSSIDNMTAAQIEKQLGSDSSLFKTVAAANTAEERSALLKSIATSKASEAGGKEQNKTYDKVTNQLEQMRGNPALQQAEKDIYASEKANTLATMYGDPNKLTQPQVNLLVSEVGKIAQGGSPSMHELDGLTPSTVTGALATAYGRLNNEPTPANAAAFVKQLQDYSKGVKKDAQKVINDKYGRVINSYKSRLTDEQNQNLKSNYLDRFNQETEAPKGSGPGGVLGFEEFLKAKGSM